VVSFCETITKDTEHQCVAKSANKHNRIYAVACPVDEKLGAEIDDGSVTMADDEKTRARYIADTYGWDVNVAKKIWAFGCPPDAKGNILVDATKAAQYLTEAKDHIMTSFVQATAGGVFCDEPMRLVQFCIEM